MKKLIHLVFIVVFLFSYTASFAEYKLSKKEILIVNKITNKIEKIINKDPLKYKDLLIKQLTKVSNKLKTWSQKKVIIDTLIKNTQKINLYNHSKNHYSKFNIDFNKVKSSWLSWHNEARKKIWVNSYSYSNILDNSAYEWSIISREKWIMEHKRNYFDSYYDYKKIEAWFNDRWVNCKVKNWTTASESIWKFWYYCKNKDCTDELIKSLKVIFDIYMAEKWLPYPQDAHYRAIVHPDLTKIWLGIALEQSFDDEYKNFKSYNYYVTTHYCTELK